MNRNLIITLIITILTTKTLQQTTIADEVDFNNTLEKTRKYEVALQEKCPNVPTRGAIDCLKNFKLSQYVSQMMAKDSVPQEFAENLIGLTECNVQQLPSTEISLNVYCYLEGMKEKILEVNEKIEGTEEQANDMIINIIKTARDKATRPDVIHFYDTILKEANGGFRSTLEIIGEVDQRNAEELMAQDMISLNGETVQTFKSRYATS